MYARPRISRRFPAALAKRHALITILAVLLVATHPAPAKDVDANSSPGAWYPVWSAIINHGMTANTNAIMILNATIAAPWSQAQPEQYLRSVDLPPGDANGFAILDRFELHTPSILMDHKSLGNLFKGGPEVGWQKFFLRFADVEGVVGLSAVRFSDDGEHASAYVTFGCGSSCGIGRIIHLQRDATASWQVVSNDLIWVADQ